ncbi:MAG TPA: ABC transporter ATP-binding protein [bacterium]|jgi:ABC-2 type transport system ATP-binding protein|nr:ABC transporter ATP-binding protein [bacterium]
MSIIEVDHLSKIYRTQKRLPGLGGAVQGLFNREYTEVRAVDDVSFSIEEGELVGFLGPNGAGKTTTLKMLSGILFPTSGMAKVMGFTPSDRKNEYRRQFALVMGQKNQLWWDLPAQESLYLNKEIYGVDDKAYHKILDEMTELLQVKRLMGIMVRELSLGERMKFELIASLLHSPRVLLLDEPTIGLDVVAQKNIREFIKDYNRRTKTTILLTSHYMNDIQALCERVVVINQGKKMFDGKLDAVVEKFSQSKIITVTFKDGGVTREQLSKLGQVLELTSVKAVLKVPREQVKKASNEILNQFDVDDIDIEEVPIEEVIEKVFAGSEADQ